MIHLFQFFQNAIVDAILFEVDADGVDHLVDDMLVNGTDGRGGHRDEWTSVLNTG